VQTSPLATPEGLDEAALHEFVTLLVHGLAASTTTPGAPPADPA
jgi:hypothetical protein